MVVNVREANTTLIALLSNLYPMMMESAMALRFPSGSSSPFHCYRPPLSSEELAGVPRRVPHCAGFDISCYRSSAGSSFSRRKNLARNKVRATAEHLDSASDPIKYNGRAGYHPFEDIAELVSNGDGAADARLTTAETVRTIVEVNDKATLLFSGVVGDEVHENILCPELPYATDSQGNIYFQVNNDEDILQQLASETLMVQVIIGLDTTEIMNDVDFGIEEIEDEDGDFEDDDDDDEDDDDEDDDDEEDWVSVLDDEDDLDESDGNLRDWAKLDTMRFSHPMSFAKKLAEVASDDPIDCMERPPVGVVIQGLLTPAVLDEKSVIPDLLSGHNSSADVNNVEIVVDNKFEDSRTSGQNQEVASRGDNSEGAEKLKESEKMRSETAFYKLEMVKIQLLSVYGPPSYSEVEEYRRARPDLIAQSANKIMSRLKAGGEKTIQALTSLCWRCKGIQVEDAMIVGIDALGFDMKVCSGTQIQTLRFAFETRVTSEHGAERQLNDLLFPKILQKSQKKKQTRRNDW